MQSEIEKGMCLDFQSKVVKEFQWYLPQFYIQLIFRAHSFYFVFLGYNNNIWGF